MKKNNHNISKQLIIYLLLFSSMITLVLTAIQLNLNYRYDLGLIDQRFEQIQLTNVQSITQKAWTVNEQGLTDELQSILKLPDITYIEFAPNESARSLIKFGEKASHRINHHIEIVYHYRNRDIKLGDLTISASLSNVYQRLIDTALIILVTQAIKTFAVSFFIFFLFQHLLTRHLSKIADFIEDHNLMNNANLLKLDRNENKWTHNDELGSLTQSINQMIINSRETIHSLGITEQRLSQAQILSNSGHWEYYIDKKQFHLNPQINSLLKLDSHTESMHLDQFLGLITSDDQSLFVNQLELAETNDSSSAFELCLHNKEAAKKFCFFVDIKLMQNQSDGSWLLGSMQDISHLVEQRNRLDFMANTDPLTGLANRNRFHQEVQQCLNRLKKMPNKSASVIIIDVDRFKDVNDALGHYAGDELLKMLSARLQTAVTDQDRIARLGGDEFAFLISGGEVHAFSFINELFKLTAKPFEVNGLQINVGLSAGIAIAPEHSNNSHELLRQADIAMYNAKQKHNGYELYCNDNDINSVRRLELMTQLKTAIEAAEFELYYQPKMTLTENGTHFNGVEALIRWNHPTYGLIPPDEFIGFAEMSNTINPLTLWVLKSAIEHRERLANHFPESIMSINVSSRNLYDRDFLTQVETLIKSKNANPNHFILEITENAIMEEPQQAAQSIQSLSEMGFDISIDDFGTGYSSLAYLKNLAVNELKIDRTFVSDMTNDDNDYKIVKSTIELAHNLGLSVTAEGVENREIEGILIELNCDITQGYYYSKPLPFEDLMNWLNEKSPNY